MREKQREKYDLRRNARKRLDKPLAAARKEL